MKIKNKRNWYSYVFFGILILGAVFLVSSLMRRNENQRSTYQVSYGDIRDEIHLAGVVDDEHRVDLGFARGGRVAQVYAREGQRVKKGQVLARLDMSREATQAERARFDTFLTQIDTEVSSEEANIEYEKLLAEQKARVDALWNELLSSDLQAKLVKENAVTKTRLVPAPVVTGVYKGGKEGRYLIHVYRSHTPSGYSFELTGLEEKDYYPVKVYQPGKLGKNGLFIQFSPTNVSWYDNTLWEVRIPNTDSPHYLERKRAYDEAVKKYDELKEKLSLQKRKLHDDSFVGLPYTHVLTERSFLQERSAFLALEDGKIRAPFDGIVARNDLEPGKIVGAFSPVIHFISGKKKVVLDVPEVYVNRIQVGEKADITLDAYPEIHYEGEVEKVDEIEKGGEGSALYGADVKFLNQDEKVRIGMSATTTFSKLIKEHVIRVPYHFLIEKEGRTFVVVKNEKDEEEREVETGVRGNDGMVEIISGLREGDLIISPNEVN